MSGEQKQRIDLWDNAKFFLMILVVAGHFLDQYPSNSFRSIFLIIYSFHMPLYLFIGGMFNNYKNIAKKVTGYFLLYVLVKVLIYVVRSLCGQQPSFSLLTESGLPWYMLAMSVYILITYLIRNTNKVIVLIVWIVMACIVGYDGTIGDYLALSRIIVFYPFFLAGTMVRRETFEQWNKKKYLKAIGLLLFAIFIFLCFYKRELLYELRPLMTGRNAFGADIQQTGPLLRLLCYAIAVLLGTSFIILCPSGRIPVITVCGTRTLQVYFWHRIALYAIVDTGIGVVVTNGIPGKIIWLCICIGLTLLFSLKIFKYPAAALMDHI